MSEDGKKVMVRNRRAFRDFHISEKLEAGTLRIAFAAGRILNEPMACRFSIFRKMFAGELSALSGISGVRSARVAIRC